MLVSKPLPVERGTTRLARVEVAGFRVAEAHFPGQLHLSSHYHEHACMTIMLDGGMREQIGGRDLDCDAGWILIKPPAERHVDDFALTGSHHVIVEPLDAETDAIPEIATLFSKVTLTRSVLATALAHRVRGELALRDTAARLSMEGLVLEMFAALLRSRPDRETRRPVWLERAFDQLNADPFADVSLNGLAAAASVHPCYFARQFRRHYGQSVGTYVRRQRLLWATQQLAESDRPLSDIALRAGFSDQSHFTRALKRELGVTPLAYRRSSQRR
jgi:AraC family transcriptional regulator